MAPGPRQGERAVRGEPLAVPFRAHDCLHHAAPSGGVRVGNELETEQWRFHNTGYFVGKHRPAIYGLFAGVAFSGVAFKRLLEYRRLSTLPILLRSMLRGWRKGRVQAADLA